MCIKMVVYVEKIHLNVAEDHPHPRIILIVEYAIKRKLFLEYS
jgi:hypothetical protein